MRLGSVVTAGLLFFAAAPARAQSIPGIGPVGSFARAYTGFQFTEGPSADALGNVYFADVFGNRLYKVDLQGRQTTFLENTQGISGLKFDSTGRLIACQRDAGRIVAIDVETKAIEPLASQYQGRRFNGPNDLVVDRNGGVYFSDPIFPFFGDQLIQDLQGVYYVTADGQVSRVIDNLTQPNGLILSPDEKTLYVLHQQPNVMAYPVQGPGQLGAGRVFAQLQFTSAGDGGTIDTLGNLYVTWPFINALQVITPEGQSLGLIRFPEAPSNAAFGGSDRKTLYVTARTSVYTATMEAAGHQFAPPGFPVAATLFFPRLVNTAAEWTGLAFVSPASQPAQLSFAAYSDTGSPIAIGGLTNPRGMALQSRNQLALIASEIFGSPLSTAGGWVQVSSSAAGLAGFFLAFDLALNTMDGVDASGRLMEDFLFPELQNAEISLVNPSRTQVAAATLRLVDNQGQPQATQPVTIPANGRFAARVSDLFSAALLNAGGHLSVTSSPGLSAVEIFGAAGATQAALNPIDTLGGSRVLYSPQYAVGGGLWKTVLTLINLENTATTVTLSLVADNGTVLGRNAAVNIPGRGRAVLADPGVLGISATGGVVQGYVRMASDRARIAGYVRFGDPSDAQFQTALPFVSEGRSDVLYAQLAQNETYFTGLAVINTNAEPADVTVTAFNPAGVQQGQGVLHLAPGTRVSQLLAQIIPQLPAMSAGYFRVSGSRPVSSFAVFGTHTLSVLSAIPAQPVSLP